MLTAILLDVAGRGRGNPVRALRRPPVREVFEDRRDCGRRRAERFVFADAATRRRRHSPATSASDTFEDGSFDLALGNDPEESHLGAEGRLLQGLAWRPLDEVSGDLQVSRVLESLDVGLEP